MHLVLSGKSETVYTEMLEAVTDACTALGFNAYSTVKVAGQGGLTVPRLRRQLRDIELFSASVVIADIRTNDLSPSSLDPKKLAENIVEYLREISEPRGVEAVVILPITPRTEEAPAKSRHHWRPNFEEARFAINRRVTDLVRAMPRIMTWRHVGGLTSTRFLLHDGVHMRCAFPGETYDVEAALQRLHVV